MHVVINQTTIHVWNAVAFHGSIFLDGLKKCPGVHIDSLCIKMSASGPSSGAGAGDPLPMHETERVDMPLPELPASMIKVYRMTKSGTIVQRRNFAKPVLARSIKPSRGRVLLGSGGFGAVFRAAIPASSTDAEAEGAGTAPDYIAVKTVFNWGLSTSKLETIDSQKEFDVLAHLPEHRNLARVLFECVCKPPVWMVEMLPDPSLVCLDLRDDGDDDGAAGEGMPSAGASALRPRKAQMVGMELLQRRMCDHLEYLEYDEPGSMPGDVLVQLSSDIAEGVHHLLQHGVVHRDLKLDNVMWDSKGGPEGVGRAVLVNLGCSLRVHLDGAAVSAADPAAAVSTASGSGTSQAEEALDGVMYRYLKDGGDGLGGNQAHLAPEVLDGWNRGSKPGRGHDDAVGAVWEAGVMGVGRSAARACYGRAAPVRGLVSW